MRRRRRRAEAGRCTSCTGRRAARRRRRCSSGGGCEGWSTGRVGQSGWAGRRSRGLGQARRSCGSTPSPSARAWPRSQSSVTALASIPASPSSSPPPLSLPLIKDMLPDVVVYQFAPLDCPDAIESFIGYWKPSLILLMESELWPNLIMSAAEKGIAVALLNARMSLKSFNRWSALGLPLVSLMLSKLSLVIPLSTIQAVRFQLLHTPPYKIHFAGDLKYAVGDVEVREKELNTIKDLQRQFNDRPIWMAASIHRGEEEVILRVHDELIKAYPSLLLILVPRHPQDVKNVSLTLKNRKVNFVLRSTMQLMSINTRVYVVDTLGELRMLYRVTPIAVVGGSFLPSLSGHNFSEAAAAGCAVLTGPHVGHFYHMLVEMWQINPLAVKQLTGEAELLEVLKELLGDSKALEARQGAAKDAFAIMSHGVVNRVWNLVSRFAIDAQKTRGIAD
ncbi:hypothetical protein ACQJBY_024101 [Aegilops geniculata]